MLLPVRGLRSFREPFCFLYNRARGVLQRHSRRNADNPVGKMPGRGDVIRCIRWSLHMKQILGYLQSYGKELLRKLGVQGAEPSVRATAWHGIKPLRVERRREARNARISPCTYGLMRSVDRDGV